MVCLPYVRPELSIDHFQLIEAIHDTLVIPYLQRGEDVEVSIKEPYDIRTVTHNQLVIHGCEPPSLCLVIDFIQLAQGFLIINEPHFCGPCQLLDAVAEQCHTLAEQRSVKVHLADHFTRFGLYLSEG